MQLTYMISPSRLSTIPVNGLLFVSIIDSESLAFSPEPFASAVRWQALAGIWEKEEFIDMRNIFAIVKNFSSKK